MDELHAERAQVPAATTAAPPTNAGVDRRWWLAAAIAVLVVGFGVSVSFVDSFSPTTAAEGRSQTVTFADGAEFEVEAIETPGGNFAYRAVAADIPLDLKPGGTEVSFQDGPVDVSAAEVDRLVKEGVVEPVVQVGVLDGQPVLLYKIPSIDAPVINQLAARFLDQTLVCLETADDVSCVDNNGLTPVAAPVGDPGSSLVWWLGVPPGTAVVHAATQDGVEMWQRPIGPFVMFPVDATTTLLEIEALDSIGRTLDIHDVDIAPVQCCEGPTKPTVAPPQGTAPAPTIAPPIQGDTAPPQNTMAPPFQPTTAPN